MAFKERVAYNISDLLEIMELLRSPNGCPWDKEQTHQSIRKNLIEETYEVVEAIDNQDTSLLKEELGDLLLQIVFHSQMEKQLGSFSFDDVCDGICKKLVLRHPHIFSDVVANTSSQVLDNWEEIKKTEKQHKTYTQSLQAVPKVLPALMRSEKIQSRAAKSGFDYPGTEWAFKDLASEVLELEAAIETGNRVDVEEELGDLLFSVVNVARFEKVDAEHCLSNACEKFTDRFSKVEKLAEMRGVDMKTASLDMLNTLWQEVKIKNN